MDKNLHIEQYVCAKTKLNVSISHGGMGSSFAIPFSLMNSNLQRAFRKDLELHLRRYNNTVVVKLSKNNLSYEYLIKDNK